jgi:hypothetical protein
VLQDPFPLPVYYLTRHTFSCVVGGTIVFLDLRADEYTCLEPKHVDRIGQLLGLPTRTQGDVETNYVKDHLEAAEPVLKEMIEAQLIMADRLCGKPASHQVENSALREMPGFDVGEGPSNRPSKVFRLTRARGALLPGDPVGLTPIRMGSPSNW